MQGNTRIWVALAIGGLALAALADRAIAQPPADAPRDGMKTTDTEEYAQFDLSMDSLTERQSVDAYNSLEDGQPGAPGEFELQFDLGWTTASGEHDEFLVEPELMYTLDGSDFLRNMQLTLDFPFDLGIGGVDGNGDAELGWQQRWVTEDGWMPTLATLAVIRVPTGYQSSGIDGTLTGVVAKDIGPGTAYFNAFGKTANGNNIEDVRRFQWGFRFGYKWRMSDSFALIADYVNQSSEENGHRNSNLLELAGEYRVNDQLTIGPGVVIGLDDNEETPNVGAGVRVLWSF